MALIKCPECGKEISDQAQSCIGCGIPMEKIKERLNHETMVFSNEFSKTNQGITEVTTPRKNTPILILAVLIIIASAMVFFFIYRKQNGQYKYIGKWQHNITWKTGNNITDRTYASIELFKDHTFTYNGYSETNKEDNLNYSGLYTVTDNIIHISFEYNGQNYKDELYIYNNILCEQKDNCEKYYVKSPKSVELALNNMLPYITDSQYNNIINEKKNAIVIFVNSTCSHCNDYVSSLINRGIYDVKGATIYLYSIETNTGQKLDAVPQTYIIKNGKVEKKISGYSGAGDLNSMVETAIKIYNNENTTEKPTTNNNNQTNNNNSNNQVQPSSPKVCDTAAKERITNEYQTTINERTAKHEEDMARTKKQIETVESLMASTGGYLSTEEYERQYAEATSDTTRQLLKARYGASQNYDKMKATYNQLEPTFQKWKETYTAWYNDELRKINCS